jgi:hypothetical protein
MADDEPRDWEQLRSDAIRAVGRALEDAERVENVAETATDAVLSVIDEETVRAVCAEIIKETYIKSMDFRDGAAMEIEPSRLAAYNWVGAARGLLGDAPNYAEATMQFGIAEDPQRYVFTVRKADGMTPHEARRKAERERDDALADLQAAREQLAALAGQTTGDEPQ